MCGRKRNGPLRVDSIQHLLIIRFKLGSNLLVALTWIVDELDRVVEIIEQDIDIADFAYEQLQGADGEMTIVIIQYPDGGCLDQKHVIDSGGWISHYFDIAC